MVLGALLSCVANAQMPAEFGKEHEKIVSLDYGDPKINDFGRAVAEAIKIPYAIEKTVSGSKIWFAPRNEEEEREVQGRVSQFAFALRACNKPELVTPETPAGSIKSC